MACGYSHSLALSDDGKVFGWGANSYGQLGSGNKANSVTPLQVFSYFLCYFVSVLFEN